LRGKGKRDGDELPRIQNEFVEEGGRFEKRISGRVQKDQKEFETYSNEKVEKGSASPLR